MPGPNSLCILFCQLDHGLICSRPADETFSRRLTEGQPKFDAWYRVHQRFVNILHGLDEMGLTENKVGGFRFFDLYGLNFHEAVSSRCSLSFSKQTWLTIIP